MIYKWWGAAPHLCLQEGKGTKDDQDLAHDCSMVNLRGSDCGIINAMPWEIRKKWDMLAIYRS